jgi:hypothetical protein
VVGFRLGVRRVMPRALTKKPQWQYVENSENASLSGLKSEAQQ